MKKILCLAIIAAMCLALVSCGEKVREDVKERIDHYEECIDDYIDIMQQYTANPTDMSLLEKIADLSEDLEEVLEDYEVLKNSELNSAEQKYLQEVIDRVSEKLKAAGLD